MNLLLLDASELERACVTLTGRRARHLRDVLGVSTGSRVRAGVVGGSYGVAEIESVSDASVVARIELREPARPRPTVDLVLALPRPKALARVLQTAATLGVGHIDLVNAWRVDKSYFQSPALAPRALEHELRIGCEQGATTWVPSVAVHRMLMPFVRERLADADDDERTRIVLHPRSAPPLEDALRPSAAVPVLAAIGPEGGWIERELDTLARLGFARARITHSTLRTETAVAALLGQIELLRRLAAGVP